jgi:hypothetical protein
MNEYTFQSKTECAKVINNKLLIITAPKPCSRNYTKYNNAKYNEVNANKINMKE